MVSLPLAWVGMDRPAAEAWVPQEVSAELVAREPTERPDRVLVDRVLSLRLPQRTWPDIRLAQAERTAPCPVDIPAAEAAEAVFSGRQTARRPGRTAGPGMEQVTPRPPIRLLAAVVADLSLLKVAVPEDPEPSS